MQHIGSGNNTVYFWDPFFFMITLVSHIRKHIFKAIPANSSSWLHFLKMPLIGFQKVSSWRYGSPVPVFSSSVHALKTRDSLSTVSHERSTESGTLSQLFARGVGGRKSGDPSSVGLGSW